MNHGQVVENVGAPALHVLSAGLTATSIAGAWGAFSGLLGSVPIFIAACAGIAAIVSYTFNTLDSPSFQRRVARWTMARKQRQLAKLRKQQVVLTAKLLALDTIEHAHDAAKKLVSDAQQGVLYPAPLMSTPPGSLSPAAGASGPTGTR